MKYEKYHGKLLKLSCCHFRMYSVIEKAKITLKREKSAVLGINEI